MVDRLIVNDVSPFTTGYQMQAVPYLLTVMKNSKLPENVSLSVARYQVNKQMADPKICVGMRGFFLLNLVMKDSKRLSILNVLGSFEGSCI